MAERRVLPYGSWPSPISVGMAVSASLSVREPRLDGNDIYWTEGRPQEDGRQVVVRWSDGTMADAIPAGYNARNMAHEYGGGAYAVNQGVVYFANLADGRIYGQPHGGEPSPITSAGALRYGDLVFDKARQRLLCVVEDHTAVSAGAGEGAHAPEPENYLAAIDPVSGRLTRLAKGFDFYSTPRPSPDGRWLAWLSWRHPNMPWDSSELWLAELTADGSLGPSRRIAGGDDVSIAQPEWGSDGSLVYVSDKSGWWNLYRLGKPANARARPKRLAPMEAEFAGPQWVFGLSWYGIDEDGSILAIARRDGRDQLWHIRARRGEPELVETGQSELRDIVVAGGRAVFIGASPTDPQAVILRDIASGEQEVLRRTAERKVDTAYISAPEPISFPTTGDQTAYALYYRPANPDAEAPIGARPPLVVMIHGGPTSNAWGGLNLTRQLFTSRGIAVVDVDYGGSTGYGRQYMRRLDGQWGIVDVDDCVNAALFLAGRGDVDANRMAITGGSAGGYTTLCALVFHDVFACGASHYGVGDLEALARDTHKFESRYLDRLVAPYPAGRDLYRERSPIYHAAGISVPVIVLQGLDDRVVPPAQAEQLVGALREQHIPYAYLAFEGEGHGFRRAENIARSLEAELSFYAQVFGFKLADDIKPVELIQTD